MTDSDRVKRVRVMLRKMRAENRELLRQIYLCNKRGSAERKRAKDYVGSSTATIRCVEASLRPDPA